MKIPTPKEFVEKQEKKVLSRVIEALKSGNNTTYHITYLTHKDALNQAKRELEKVGWVVRITETPFGHKITCTCKP